MRWRIGDSALANSGRRDSRFLAAADPRRGLLLWVLVDPEEEKSPKERIRTLRWPGIRETGTGPIARTRRRVTGA